MRLISPLLLAKATRPWNGAPASTVIVGFLKDAGSYVQVRDSYEPGVKQPIDVITFEAATGAVLQDHRASPILDTHRVIGGLHLVQFRHWAIRWIYFVLGLAGCVLIATGLLFWIESRRKRYAAPGLTGRTGRTFAESGQPPLRWSGPRRHG